MVGLEVPGKGLYYLSCSLWVTPHVVPLQWKLKTLERNSAKENDEGAFVSCEPVTGAKNVQKAWSYVALCNHDYMIYIYNYIYTYIGVSKNRGVSPKMDGL